MIEHDLEYTEKEVYHCMDCRGEVEHFRVGFNDDHFDDYEGAVLVMECRLCELKTPVPATMFDTGQLSTLIVKR